MCEQAKTTGELAGCSSTTYIQIRDFRLASCELVINNIIITTTYDIMTSQCCSEIKSKQNEGGD